MNSIAIAETDTEIQECFPVMNELRPHLRAAEFVARVRRQQKDHGYQLVFLKDEGQIKAMAGFRISDCLASGRFLYVDDLVTTANGRGKGYGQQLMDWLLARAREERCDEFHLDSGVQRFEAHGFYLKNRLHIKSHHFSRSLS